MENITQLAGTVDCRPVARYKLRHESRCVSCEVDSKFKARKILLRYQFMRIKEGAIFFSIKPIHSQERGLLHAVSGANHTLTIYGKHKNGEPVNIYKNTNSQTLRLVGSVWEAPGSNRIPKSTAILIENFMFLQKINCSQ
jgi:hypothetical protein